ncbi:MAG TPA: general secretion pathway protein GspB [Steroidobacteraceae bacterium]|nr:general secretion pathway protein GspB [Steroidobacteraceae bacterium]
MSFILDALRKSEHARQKQTGPGLAEVPVVATKPKSNVWATAAIALLVVNLVAVGVLLLRRANDETPPAAAASAPVTTAPARPVADAAAPPATPSAAEPTLSSEPPPPVTTPVARDSAPRPAAGGRNPLAEEVGGAVDPSLVAAASAPPPGPPAVTRQAAPTRRGGTVVYAPIPEAEDLSYAPPPAAPAPAADNLPTADEVSARGGLPELHLDLHVYANTPQQRFIFVNSRKYREGEALQEGPIVEQITATGAVLSYRGARFKLTND